MSQSVFAEKFGLKRASVGAYEEGRAEPKINTIVDIANYFGITVDNLLLKELSVNSLSRLEIFQDDFSNGVPNNLTPKSKAVGILEVPFVAVDGRDDYFNSENPMNNLPLLAFPLEKGYRYIAYEIGIDGLILNGSKLTQGDVVVCRLAADQKPEMVEVGCVYLFEFKEAFSVNKVLAKSLSKLKLGDESEFSYSQEWNTRDLVRIWQVKAILAHGISESSFYESRLKALENELKSIKKRLPADGK